ncbi:hypothetical protein BDP27DRAFT_71716 [Rhodocollybia butyracea]|uniref:Uncharacterized protein n=1 Tax=Rhodocollybia butyracea TaxID=206335 RepID=A0A9P5PH27_9AGAR|nr:hypothetical protein BDP27DRAFT_71716 [Rhodocollybia butyracea]
MSMNVFKWLLPLPSLILEVRDKEAGGCSGDVSLPRYLGTGMPALPAVAVLTRIRIGFGKELAHPIPSDVARLYKQHLLPRQLLFHIPPPFSLSQWVQQA